MCSINGLIKLTSSTDHDAEIIETLFNVIKNAQRRGKDSSGIVLLGKNGSQLFRVIGTPCELLNHRRGDDIRRSFCEGDINIVLNNNRAEPTTEYVRNKTVEDVQPYVYKDWWIVHNGTIANDQEIYSNMGIDREEIPTRIDSYSIAVALSNVDNPNDHSEVLAVLRDQLVGSYSLCAYHMGSDTVYFATNYKPLSLILNRKWKTLFFSSFSDYYVDFAKKDIVDIFSDLKPIIYDVPPYTLFALSLQDFKLHKYSLYKEKENTRRKALICASSGMDSTVAATWAKSKGYDVTLLHFDYHCRAAKKERSAIKKIAEYLQAELVTINVDFFRDVIKGSRLTNNLDTEISDGIAGAELAIEWVPARNLIFMSIAAGYAEAHDIDYIVLGGNLEESGAYPDNELIFQRKFNDILPNSLNLQRKVEVLTPVADLMKHEIVKLGLELGAPLHLTWSCYEDGELHCGNCGPCYMRRLAFEMNGVPEVIQYETDVISGQV